MAKHARLLCICFAAMLLVGCATARQYPPVDLPPAARLVELANKSAYPASNEIRRVDGVQPVERARRQILVLSSGADYGAYTAGVLKGWTAIGTRPRFDVVTGISTGALIAPLAFLGPEYDDTLARGYTEARAGDVYRRRPLPALLWSDSLADSAPLRRRIDMEITSELLGKIARAHSEGRRLYVGTTDLDTKRLVVWDLGALAASADPNKLQLFRSVLLASASVPGFLPPVPINVEVDGQKHTELHVDGVVSASLLLDAAMLGQEPDRPRTGRTANASVYVIVAGKLWSAPRPVKGRLLSVVEESIRGVLQARFEGDLLKVYQLARQAGAEFGLTAVPDDFPDQSDGLSFDPHVMTKLFERGYQDGARALAGHSSPPELSKLGEHLPPRAGTNFTVGQNALD